MAVRPLLRSSRSLFFNAIFIYKAPRPFTTFCFLRNDLTIDEVRNIVENPSRTRHFAEETIQGFIRQKDVYREISKLEQALALAKKNSLSLFPIYKHLLVTFLKAQNFEKAQQLVKDARADNVVFDENQLKQAINVCIPSAKDRIRCCVLLELSTLDIDQDLQRPSSSLINKLQKYERAKQFGFEIDLAVEENRPHEALRVYQRSKEEKIQLLPKAYDSLLTVICNTHGEETLAIFKEILSLNIPLQINMVNSVLVVYSVRGAIQKLNELWARFFQKHTLKPNMFSFQCVLRGCINALKKKVSSADDVVRCAEEYYQQLLSLDDGIPYLLMLRVYALSHSPKTTQFFSDHINKMEASDQLLAISTILKMAADTKRLDLVKLAVQTQESLKIEFQRGDYFQLACFFAETNELALAVQSIERVVASQPFRNKNRTDYKWTALRNSIIKEGRHDLLQRLDAAVSPPKHFYLKIDNTLIK